MVRDYWRVKVSDTVKAYLCILGMFGLCGVQFLIQAFIRYMSCAPDCTYTGVCMDALRFSMSLIRRLW